MTLLSQYAFQRFTVTADTAESRKEVILIENTITLSAERIVTKFQASE